MQFTFYPKHEYGRPNISHCPHLDGAALGTLVLAAEEETEWTDALMRRINALEAQSKAKSRLIEEQAAIIEQLKWELKAERQRQFKASTPKDEPPAESNEGQAGTKKQGAPVGHPGWFGEK